MMLAELEFDCALSMNEVVMTTFWTPTQVGRAAETARGDQP
jgi:hypothetical protein